MRTSRSFLPFVLAAALLLAGCAGGKKAAEPSSDPSVIDAGSGGGHIEGTVIDDSYTPISGAEVGLLDSNHVAITDEAGAFRFVNLAPGTYQIAANRLGFNTATRAVDVLEGETANAVITLVAIAIVEGYPEVRGPIKGFANCVFGSAAVAGPCVGIGAAYDSQPNEKSHVIFRMNKDTISMVAELTWRQSTAATGQNLGLFFTHRGSDGFHWWCNGAGKSPVRWQYNWEDDECIASGASPAQQETEGAPPTAKQDLRLALTIPFRPLVPSSSDPAPVHISVQQDFEVTYTLFQNMVAPEGYTALDDA